MLKYYPNRGEILICNYSGFKEPEMVKTRPVIIISPRFRNRDKLCTVIPLSTTPPRIREKYHLQLYLPRRMPEPFNSQLPWIKADMINTVSRDRLSLMKCGKNPDGTRKYYRAKLSDEELHKIEEAIKFALGIK